MIRTILVPMGGSQSDDAVLPLALATGRRLGAHLDFYHLRLGAADAVPYVPHAEFLIGDALTDAFEAIGRQAAERSVAASDRFRRLCAEETLRAAEPGTYPAGFSVGWVEEQGPLPGALLQRARHADLTIVGRRRQIDGLPGDLLERLLLESGRPLLIAGDEPPTDGTVVAVAWKEGPSAARALGAAMPFLVTADRIILLAAEEERAPDAAALNGLARQLAWHGIAPACRILPGDGGSAADRLLAAARGESASLLVMGGYGHSRAREWVFGGVTQAVLAAAGLPVLLLH